jgi:hypothetical protein
MIYDITFVREFEFRSMVSDQWVYWLPVSVHGFIHRDHKLSDPINTEKGWGFNIECCSPRDFRDGGGDGTGNGYQHNFGIFHSGNGRDMKEMQKTGFIAGCGHYS